MDSSMKINYKLRGTNHKLEFPWYGANATTMVVGADVTHSAKGSNAPSVAGVVATCDEYDGRYLASARIQTCKTEYIEDLEGMIEERLEVFFAHNGKLPNEILFYRDGVSESQYGMVYLDELPKVKAGCLAIGEKRQIPGYDPKITMLVVGKRHHTRFYPKDSPKDKVGKNLNPGLVIDHTIVTPQYDNFYLQSHDSPEGTARSGHYVVISNDSGYTPEKLQEVTYRLCFTGSRAPTSLSICTPARYADLLCDRLRAYLRPIFERKEGFKDFPPDRPLDEYRACSTTWTSASNDNGSKLPWHGKLEDSMFYL
ncbi:putative protein tag-76 [Lachnellula suecica]|uniref:Piwi domain-containing protein n=1 Tax=Lachnellula suecica TaxID=602035 RepID=A0A8T9CBR6_9HELO|nr:putative protein tag-76 [Lachnellula suecica]